MNTIKTISLSIFSLILSIAVNAQTFKEPVAYKLKNGMNIIISENSHSPKAFASFTLDERGFTNKKDAIVEMLNAVINESITAGGSLTFNDKSGKLAISNSDLEKGLSNMASVFQQVIIDQNTFNNAKTKLLASLKSQKYDYDQLVNETSINNLTLMDVKDFYNQISPDKTYLTIAGDVETNASKLLVKKFFGNWGKNTLSENTYTAK